jgi:polyphosphate kinase
VFCNGGDNLYYISSGDWMIRNFDNRIEVACPIYDREIQKELRTMLDIQWKDNIKARIIGPNEPNQYRKTDGPPVQSQIELYRYFRQR